MACAETIFENGWIYTGEDERPVRAALAVAGGRVLAVGDGAELASPATSATIRVDLRGRLLIPGFKMPTSTRSWPASNTCSATSPRPPVPRRQWPRCAATPSHIPTSRGSSRGLVDGLLCWWNAHPADAGRGGI